MSVLMAEVQDHCRVAIRLAWAVLIGKSHIHFRAPIPVRLMALHGSGRLDERAASRSATGGGRRADHHAAVAPERAHLQTITLQHGTLLHQRLVQA